jgi:hypothetical protein
MIEQVDRNRPKGKRFSEKFFLHHLTLEILDKYYRLFPDGKLRRRWRVGLALSIAGYIGTVACMFLGTR